VECRLRHQHLATYLRDPEFADEAELEEVTARHVLSHTSGWPNWRPTGQPLRRDTRPGTRFGYSGEGYVYLQRVVEHITGQPLDAFIRTHVFEPMVMRHSSFVSAPAEDSAVAAAHDRDGAPIVRHIANEPNAASSLHTMARDFGRFLEVLLGSGDESWRLRGASVSEMLRAQARAGCRIAWGLGWGLATTAAGATFWHWGDNPGYKCFAVALRDTRTGVVVMTNGDAGLAVCGWIVHRAQAGNHPAFGWLNRQYAQIWTKTVRTTA
jgi:CubicO group peptidase (beta-lactamase class C family)